jgi:FkbM family methyltransferase
MDLEKKLFKGVWTANRRVDRRMINECIKNYSHFKLGQEDTVLDLGANIGGFAVMCKDVKRYIGYEPDPINCEILRLNASFRGAEVRQSACSMSKEKELTFWQTLSENAACSGSVVNKKCRKKTYQVKNENIMKVLEEIKPTVLKIDIEGAEKEWLETINCKIPEYVQQFSIEIHDKDTFAKMNDEWIDEIRQNFDILSIAPNTGFANENSIPVVYENLGINVKAIVFGIDIVARRKK